MVSVSPGYFETLRLQVIRGRGLHGHRRHAGPRERRSSISASWRCTSPARIRSDAASASSTRRRRLHRHRRFRPPSSASCRRCGSGTSRSPIPIRSSTCRIAPIRSGSSTLIVRTQAEPGTHHIARARGDARDRSGSAALRHSDDGSAAGAAAVAVPRLREHVRHLRGHRAGAVGGRVCTPSRRIRSRSGRRRSASAWRSGAQPSR